MSFRNYTARLLLLIVTLTMASPHFAWEAVAQDAHHEIGAGSLVVLDAHDHETCVPGLDHHDDHTCSGHMFGHTPAQVSSSYSPFTAEARDIFVSVSETSKPSHNPDSPERPPRFRHA
ncbi:MAG: hypothetical protein HYS19_01205 [Nitrosomonadales bacterium]|nr:hypothetical protein [Nitrosomonadales bacterium]